MNRRQFTRKSAECAANANLRRTLNKAAAHYGAVREGLCRSLDDRAVRFRRAAETRQRSLENLPELLERLEENAVMAGTRVHWAEDAAAAREIIASVAEKSGARRVVKGKSMLSEEIALNPHLEAAGIEVTETDLGEFIVQLAGEPPSHIMSPALHMSREDVSRLFADKLGETAETAEELTGIARARLREKFLAADMGITGANMAVADTGTVVLVENEGNIRMSTTCPRVHVAVMSIEKVVASFQDAMDVLHVLPLSASGVKISSYVSLFTGPRRADEATGADEFHLVILDNGRSRLMADPKLRRILACMRCGGCLTVCPVYQLVGGHAYQTVYPGPMGTLLTPQLFGPQAAPELPLACTMCGACAEMCPAGIDHPDLILKLREKMRSDPDWKVAPTLLPKLGASLFAAAMRTPALYRAGAALTRAVDPRLKLVARLPGVRGYARSRAMPRLGASFSRRWKTEGRDE